VSRQQARLPFRSDRVGEADRDIFLNVAWQNVFKCAMQLSNSMLKDKQCEKSIFRYSGKLSFTFSLALNISFALMFAIVLPPWCLFCFQALLAF
jgi:hypothetical protein